jgi:hypothetical protein
MVSFSARQVRSVAGLPLVAGFAILLHYPVLRIQGFIPKDDWKPLMSTVNRPRHPQVERNLRLRLEPSEWDPSATPIYNVVQIEKHRCSSRAPPLAGETLGWGRLHSFSRGLVSPWLFLRRHFGLTLPRWWVDLLKSFKKSSSAVVMLALLFLVRERARRGWLDWGGRVHRLAGLTKRPRPSVPGPDALPSTSVIFIQPLPRSSANCDGHCRRWVRSSGRWSVFYVFRMTLRTGGCRKPVVLSWSGSLAWSECR